MFLLAESTGKRKDCYPDSSGQNLLRYTRVSYSLEYHTLMQIFNRERVFSKGGEVGDDKRDGVVMLVTVVTCGRRKMA